MANAPNPKHAFKPGDKIRIHVNGVPVITEIDAEGVQRFPCERILAFLRIQAEHAFDMNKLAAMVAKGIFTNDERRQFYQRIGYSVDGYAEVFPDDRIDNPLWEST